jgi:uncharacterized repeat protein (TIGR01451 family)
VIRRACTSNDDASTVTKETSTVPLLRRPSVRLLSGYIATALALLAVAGISPVSASAAKSPVWDLTVTSYPTNFAPNAVREFPGVPEYLISATNIGGGPSSGPITVTDPLPSGLTLQGYNPCEEIPTPGPVTCTSEEPVYPGETVYFEIHFKVGNLPDPTTLVNTAKIEGGGAPPAQASTTTTITHALPSFDYLPGQAGQNASLTGPDGVPATQAGSHPYQLTVDIGFPSLKTAASIIGADGGIRDVSTAVPRGVVVNPLVTPIRCTEAQLEANDACPAASQIGTITITTTVAGVLPYISPLFNMVPPPGSASDFGFDAVGAGAYIHILGGARAGDYALAAGTNEVLAIGRHPLMGVQVQFWGDPSSSSHDTLRGNCLSTYTEPGQKPDTCPVPAQTTPFLTMPTHCRDSLITETSIDSWGHPGEFHERSFQHIDPLGNPTAITGCNAVQFAPSLQARPTTNVADAPSGLEADLKIPQTNNLNTLATAHLKKAVVTLPEGLVLNPSSANGLEGCSSAQAGVDPNTGVPNGNHATCPDASRIGSVEVDTPLLDHPLPGSVFVATPHDNPFDSLLAIYVVVDDAQSGTIVKLPGHVIPDPQTGRLTTVFDNNPQLPFSSFKLDFFGGATAALRTPATCGTYSTTSEMTPWSAPDSGPPATPSDTYAISQGPGGSCASNASALPSKPSFDAGSVTPIAGAYTPFVLNLRRDDGTQQFSAIDVSPPPGLVGKLAGTPYCPEDALAAAAQKTGNQERQSPSCPAASKIGTVTVGAGAGPAPYYTQGTAYLTGPYKGAPLSLAIITPAAAGPYDLGTVVVRAAIHVDPATARISTTSDPIPSILQGIPLDVRSVQVSLDKPRFTSNPTSCDPFSVDGRLTTTLGQSTSLASRFQVAECGRLAFKPKLSLKLKGGTTRGAHPALRGVLTMPEGGANIARASVALPHSEFLDQGHIGTVCTRVQYAAGECPAASVYGQATAFSPLLDQPLSGPVYLRSSSNKLPDLVASLDGQIHVDVAGRVDSVNGGIRTTFEGVPDAPVSKFILSMQGGKKGLLQNSTNLCKSVNKAAAEFDGQNAKTAVLKPVLRNSCKGKPHRKHRRHHAR